MEVKQNKPKFIIQQSDLLLSTYPSKSNCRAQINYFDQWLEEEQKYPLLIVSPSGSGKKTLLGSYINHLKQKSTNVVLPYFSSASPVYSNVLYKIMLKLRGIFGINQKIELNEEKLRRYFKYWLDKASDQIDKDYLGYPKNQKKKVVIILEGVDQFTNSKGEPVDPQFWLPPILPSNIRLILSAKKQLQGIKNAQIFQYSLSEQIKNKFYQSLQSKSREINEKNNFTLRQIMYINQMVKINSYFNPKTSVFSSILDEYIDTNSNKILSKNEISSLLLLLSITHKGLKEHQIKKMTQMSSKSFAQFLSSFSFLITIYEDFYIILNKEVKEAILQVVDPLHEKQIKYHFLISEVIKKEPSSFRKLQEEIYHLIKCQNFNQLKEIVTKVENFLLLYTPRTKNLLCESWIILESEQYDPVYEYNKGVQTFINHYYPSQEDLYRILFQLCMFFKEYSEFQNWKTPKFRHPFIKAEVGHLDNVNMFDELDKMSMVGKIKSKVKQQTDCKVTERKSNKKQIKSTFTTLKEIKEQNQDTQTVTITPRNSVKNIEKVPQVFEIEQLNITIETNQQKFRQTFLRNMKQYLSRYYLPMKRIALHQHEMFGDQSDNEQENQSQIIRIDIEKIKEGLLLKKFSEYLKESYHKTGEEIHYYYYKQWLWLQFPWLSQSVENRYSQMIQQCLTSSIQFMTPEKEQQLIKNVLKIAGKARQSKISIFNEKKIQLLSIRNNDIANSKVRKLMMNDSFGQKQSNFESRFLKEPKEKSKRKWTINLIDEQLESQRQKDYHFKQQYASILKLKRSEVSMIRNSNNFSEQNMFLTEALDSSKNSIRLPILSKSKITVNVNQGTDSRGFQMCIKKFNQVKNENQQLVYKIEELMKTAQMMEESTVKNSCKVKEKISKLFLKKEIISKHFTEQMMLKEKLEQIIKICQMNKMYGSESENLAFYFNSLRHMLKLEETKLNSYKSQILKFVEENKVEVKKLRNEKKEIIQKQNTEKLKVFDQKNKTKVTQSDQFKKTLDKKQIFKKKTKKMIETSHAWQYSSVQRILGLKYGQNQKIQDQLQLFNEKMTKNKQLAIKNTELKHQISTKKKELTYFSAQLKMMAQKKKEQRILKTRTELISKRRQIEALRQRHLLIQRSLENLSQLKA